jgi:hypothetical protein
MVEISAVAMTAAGINFVTEGHDSGKLVAAVAPLKARFHEALAAAGALAAPPSLDTVQAQYLDLISLYERASAEMLKVGQDNDDEHLIDAQVMSERASEELVKAGDVLWPGEHKSN